MVHSPSCSKDLRKDVMCRIRKSRMLPALVFATVHIYNILVYPRKTCLCLYAFMLAVVETELRVWKGEKAG